MQEKLKNMWSRFNFKKRFKTQGVPQGDVFQTVHKVMVVDNDRYYLSLLQKDLFACGLEVKACENAVEAMLGSMLEKFDFIITDYDMPGMDGIELTRRLRKKLPDTVIIGMSGEKNVEERFLRTGANDFLKKPFLPERLTMMITGDDILS